MDYPITRKGTILPSNLTYFYFLTSPHQGYQQREAFILTQAPLENTIQDFWRMLWEYEVISVVMISSAKERDMVSCHYEIEREGTRYVKLPVNIFCLSSRFETKGLIT